MNIDKRDCNTKTRLENHPVYGPVCVVITIPGPLGACRPSENVVKRQTDCSDYREVSGFTVSNSSPEFKLDEMHSAV